MNNIVGLFRKSRNMLEKGGITPVVEEKMRCPSCKSYETKRAVAKNKMVCPNCGHHYRIGARTRVKALFDRDSFQELFANITTVDPLEFPGYAEKMERGRAVSGETEGVLCGTAAIRRQPCAVFIMEPQFMMGSMGSVVGEKIARLFEYAEENQLNLTIIKEGMYPLFRIDNLEYKAERIFDRFGATIHCSLTNPEELETGLEHIPPARKRLYSFFHGPWFFLLVLFIVMAISRQSFFWAFFVLAMVGPYLFWLFIRYFR